MYDLNSILFNFITHLYVIYSAVYSKSDVYLLDEPLSALDAEVGRHIVEKCILGILRDKTRVLVTHQVQYLKPMTEVIVLVDGKTIARGKYEDVVNSGVELGDILNSRSCSLKCNSKGDMICRLNQYGYRNSLHISSSAFENLEMEHPEIGIPEEPIISESKKEIKEYVLSVYSIKMKILSYY